MDGNALGTHIDQRSAALECRTERELWIQYDSTEFEQEPALPNAATLRSNKHENPGAMPDWVRILIHVDTEIPILRWRGLACGLTRGLGGASARSGGSGMTAA